MEVIGELNAFLMGWVSYFRHAACKSHLQRMDQWIRRKLRCLRLKQRKRTFAIAEFLHQLGVPQWRADRCPQRQRVVATERQRPGDGGYDAGVVRLAGTRQSGSAI